MSTADRFDLAVTLRRIVRRFLAGQHSFGLKELEVELQNVRATLGKAPLQGGWASDAVQRVCRNTELNKLHSPTNWHYVRSSSRKWRPKPSLLLNWRFLHSHPYDLVFETVRRGYMDGQTFRTHESHLVDLEFHLVNPGSIELQRFLQGRKGLYVAKYPTANHIGQTDEVLTRWREHSRLGASAMLFGCTKSADEPTFDALYIAEALVIRSCSDALILRSLRCKDRKPTERFLLEGSALALSFQAGFEAWCQANTFPLLIRRHL